ncbi:DUF4817 domain-containing protein [Trichonephila clavipes]|uniref:DUF4817 domain-containing protein n=1 Tax=Trichonephila clavipes TaxID=2585209 RepID=A0A8X6RFV5_TRICX|nr:DUF4817 domain-containing protein [Trichonephila clavipes]
MRERISCTSSRSMLTLPEKALLVKLYYQNGECARVQRYVPIAIQRGKGPLTNAAMARMISKFEATGCLDDRPIVADRAHGGMLLRRRTLRCYPYKIYRHHELLPGDSVNRRAFAVWAFQKMAEDDDWLSNLLWTDEAHFTLRGSVNTHNCRIWATENPRTVVETPLHD